WETRLATDEKIRFIAIEGVLKPENTALARNLSQMANARPILEAEFLSPLVNIHSTDPKDMAFKKHMLHLMDRYKMLKQIHQTEIFFEQVICDYLFYADRVYANLKLDNEDMHLYDTMMNVMERELPIPDLVIYLQSNIDTVMEKIHTRHALGNASKERQRMDETYIAALNEEFNQFFLYYRWSPVLIVNANQLDPENTHHLEDLYQRLDTRLSGVVYYNPPA
ncbi:MAG TPA: deoxynucleoside kinase, partial [bacterium]|nr:deoxynucleoside kinase [bacterium]